MFCICSDKCFHQIDCLTSMIIAVSEFALVVVSFHNIIFLYCSWFRVEKCFHSLSFHNWVLFYSFLSHFKLVHFSFGFVSSSHGKNTHTHTNYIYICIANNSRIFFYWNKKEQYQLILILKPLNEQSSDVLIFSFSYKYIYEISC